MKEQDHDFGFTFTSEEDFIPPVDKVQGLYDMIMPLLNNLKKNPEKDYLKWPNRAKKVDEFIKKIDDYMKN